MSAPRLVITPKSAPSTASGPSQLGGTADGTVRPDLDPLQLFQRLYTVGDLRARLYDEAWLAEHKRLSRDLLRTHLARQRQALACARPHGAEGAIGRGRAGNRPRAGLVPILEPGRHAAGRHMS